MSNSVLKGKNDHEHASVLARSNSKNNGSLTIRLTIKVGNFSGDKGRFPLKKKFRFEISEISRAQRNGTVHSGYTDPTQATARLVIVLVSRGQQFCQMEGDISVRPTGQRRPPSKLVPNIPGGPNRNGLFHMMYQPKFPKFGVECKAPKMIRILINSSKSFLSKLFLV